MKKLLCVSCCALMLGACVSAEEQARLAAAARKVAKEEAARKAAEEEVARKAEEFNTFKEIEADLAKNRDTIETIRFFYLYGSHFYTDGYTDGCEGCDLFKQTPIDKKCLVTTDDGYADKSDECIKARRKSKNTVIGYFNFKKYLPKNSTIKTEQDFLELFSLSFKECLYSQERCSLAGQFVVRQCHKLTEKTQDEKDKCLKEEEDFIRNFALGRAKKCSAKYPALYKKFTQNINRDINSYNKQVESMGREFVNPFLAAVYAAAVTPSAEPFDEKFGLINLCVPDTQFSIICNYYVTSDCFHFEYNWDDRSKNYWYYENGKRQEGIRKDKANGLAKAYYENGKIYREIPHKKGKANGLAKAYYENGNLKAEAMFKDGKRNGIEKHYYENGKIYQEFPYENDKVNGLAKEYYENGKIYQEFPYENDKVNGLAKAYYENGNLKAEAMFKDGKKNGVEKYYYENGNLKAEAMFKDGKKNGVETIYDENKNLKTTTVFEDGKEVSVQE